MCLGERSISGLCPLAQAGLSRTTLRRLHFSDQIEKHFGDNGYRVGVGRRFLFESNAEIFKSFERRYEKHHTFVLWAWLE